MSHPTYAGSHMTGMIEAAVFLFCFALPSLGLLRLSIRCCRARATCAPWRNFSGTVWVNRGAERRYRLRRIGGR